MNFGNCFIAFFLPPFPSSLSLRNGASFLSRLLLKLKISFVQFFCASPDFSQFEWHSKDLAHNITKSILNTLCKVEQNRTKTSFIRMCSGYTTVLTTKLSNLKTISNDPDKFILKLYLINRFKKKKNSNNRLGS